MWGLAASLQLPLVVGRRGNSSLNRFYFWVRENCTCLVSRCPWPKPADSTPDTRLESAPSNFPGNCKQKSKKKKKDKWHEGTAGHVTHRRHSHLLNETMRKVREDRLTLTVFTYIQSQHENKEPEMPYWIKSISQAPSAPRNHWGPLDFATQVAQSMHFSQVVELAEEHGMFQS